MGLHSADWFQKTGPILATSSCQLPHAKSSFEVETVFSPAAVLLKMLFVDLLLRDNTFKLIQTPRFAVAIVPGGYMRRAAGLDYHRR